MYVCMYVCETAMCSVYLLYLFLVILLYFMKKSHNDSFGYSYVGNSTLIHSKCVKKKKSMCNV